MNLTSCYRVPLLLLISLLLCACIGSPLSSNSVAGLYPWNAQDMPLTTRQGLLTEDQIDGDYYFGDLLTEHPELTGRTDEPWLLEACDVQHCYSMVLFGSVFSLNKKGEIYGSASLTAFSTMMVNEVRDLPASEIRDALNLLAGRVSKSGSYNYADFIRLDLRRNPEQREELLYDALYAEAEALLKQNPNATIGELLDQPAESTADLIVSQGFDFDSSWKMKVDIDLVHAIDEATYVFLCKDFVESESGYTIDYDSCPLRAPLTSGKWQGDLTLTGTTTKMLAVIMQVAEPNAPAYQLWQREVNGDILLLR